MAFEDDDTELTPLPPPPGSKKPTIDTHDRITANFNIHFEHKGEDPQSVEVKWSEWFVPSDEEPYSRKARALQEWELVDFGWLKHNYSLVILRNLGDTTLQVRFNSPSTIDSPADLVIPPGRFLACYPTDDQMWVRSHAASPYRVNVYPK